MKSARFVASKSQPVVKGAFKKAASFGFENLESSLENEEKRQSQNLYKNASIVILFVNGVAVLHS